MHTLSNTHRQGILQIVGDACGHKDMPQSVTIEPAPGYEWLNIFYPGFSGLGEN